VQPFESVSPHSSTPTRPSVARILSAWCKHQLGAELFGMPGYGLTLRGRTPDGFLAAPHDARPADVRLGKAVLAGRFALADARMSVQGSGDPWNRPSPSRAFAAELHRFSWLPSLMAQGEPGAKEALRLFVLWLRTFRRWAPFPWGASILPRRLINLSAHARRIAAAGTPEDGVWLAQSLSEQGRHLLRLYNDPATQATRAIALSLLGCVLSGRIGDGFRRKGLKRLPAALKRTVLADGGHASRSPQAALELLYDLLMLEDALAQRSLAIPPAVEQAVEALSRFVRALSHPNGSLCAFQGGEGVSETRIAPALVHTDGKAGALPGALEQSRYQRLIARSLSVFVDAGEPRMDAFGTAACDQPMNFEASGGHDKLIVSNGWSPLQADRQAFRVIGAGNGLSIGEDAILAPVTGPFGPLLDNALEGPRYKVRSRRAEAESAGVLLEMEHDGWKPKYGMRHERRLYIDLQRDELRGEDRLTAIETRKDLPMAAPFAIRFVLHPEVQASLARDRKSILLRGPGGRGWWLRHDARDVTLEDNGTVFEAGQPRRTTVIALRGSCRLDAATRVRWKLSPAEA
jgi:uncharacterized heparinase superfamily protein